MHFGQRISSVEHGAMIVAQTLAFGLFIFPNDLHLSAGHSAIYAFILIGVIAAVAMVIMNKLAARFPGRSVGEFLPEITGRIVGVPLMVLLIIAHTFWLGIAVRIFSDLISTQILRETPLEIITFTMILGVAYVAYKGIETIGRFSVFVMSLTYLAIGAIFLFSLKDFDPTTAKPLFVGVEPIVTAALNAYYVVMGIQITLVTYAFTPGGVKVTRAAFIALGLLWGLLILILISVSGIAGTEAAKTLNWPGILVLRLIEIPGTFVERTGLFILVTWTASVFCLCTVLLWGISLFTTQAFNFDMGKTKFFIVPVGLGSYWFSMFPQDYESVQDVALPIISAVGLVSTLVIPLILWIIAMLRGLGESSRAKTGDR